MAYKIFMGELIANKAFIFGTGFGTFKAFADTIQRKHNFFVEKDGTIWLWAWLHSDWLQGVFETGLFSVLIFLFIYFIALKKCFIRGDKEMFSLGLAIGASALFDYPLRWFSFAILIAFFVVHSLQREEAI